MHIVEHLATTLMILFWCIFFSIAIFVFNYGRIGRPIVMMDTQDQLKGSALFPALVLAPLAVALAFKLLHFNLIYPIKVVATFWELFFGAIPPAVVLVFASGLFQCLRKSSTERFIFWKNYQFAKVELAFGKNLKKNLRKLVFFESMTVAWSISLPWVFSELIVIEAVFNAPGLGLAAWQAARERELGALGLDLVILMVLYGVLAYFSAKFHHKLGVKLEGYA